MACIFAGLTRSLKIMTGISDVARVMKPTTRTAQGNRISPMNRYRTISRVTPPRAEPDAATPMATASLVLKYCGMMAMREKKTVTSNANGEALSQHNLSESGTKTEYHKSKHNHEGSKQ